MTPLLQYAALSCVAAGLICGLVTLLVAHRVLLALRVALDFWLAASLLRLAPPATATYLLVTAMIIAIRQLTTAALKPGGEVRR